MKTPFPGLTPTGRNDFYPAIEYTAGDVTHHGETMAITGARSGLGRAAAIVFVKAVSLFWLFTVDDVATFVVPNVAFGLCGALSKPIAAPEPSNAANFIFRLLQVVFFTWSNLLVFDLANQRLPEAVREDALNKPWRPIPRGLVTSVQARRAMLLCMPLIPGANYLLGVGVETALLFVLTWLYNNLQGGDENWICRNIIIAAAFYLYNSGSVKVVCINCNVTDMGAAWTIMVSGVILTTMHVQDLKDQQGDSARGRRSAPLVLGDAPARWTLAVPICIWSYSCAQFWDVGLTAGSAVVILGFVVATRCVGYSGKQSDRRTWKLWALWLATLYMLPLVH
ncbi:UbiA prenyltransferase family [Apiospora rasikravindrae]|uniref:UbiA prenyltransferase family n=1 Tax=Apiospora rasikravindrae TaxID=990691 RepID=A0ABR1S1X3_9PEZI